MPTLFPYRPLAPVLEALAWQTDVQESFAGDETRRAVRAIPRQEWEWLVAVTDRRYLPMLRGRQTEEWYVPAWQEAEQTTVLIASGATSFAVADATVGEWRDRVLLWASPTACETVAIASVDGNTINLSTPTSQAYPVGSTVAPVRQARCLGPIQLQDARRYALLSLTWLITDAAALTGVTLAMQYAGRDVWLDTVIAPEGQLERALEAPVEYVDYGTGPIGAVVRYPESRWTWPTATLRYTERADAWALKRWLYTLQGRYGSFLAPIKKDEIRISAAFGAADETIRIGSLAWSALDSTTNNGYLLFQRYGSLDPIIREVLSVAVIDADTEELTLDEALGIAGGPTTFRYVGWLHTYRLEADRVELSWEPAGQLAVSFPWREIEEPVVVVLPYDLLTEFLIEIRPDMEMNVAAVEETAFTLEIFDAAP